MGRPPKPVDVTISATDPAAKDLSLILLAVANVGVMRAGSHLACLAAWCIARHEIGPGMDAEGYGEWWGMSRSQAFRDMGKIRAALPGVDPEKVYRLVVERLGQRKGLLDRGRELEVAGELSAVPAGVLV